MENEKSDKPNKKKPSNSLYLAIFIIAVITIAFVIASQSNLFLTSYQKYYAGGVRNFRGNLDEAAKVPVYPNQMSVIDVLLNPEVYRIQIAFFPNETENSYYFASSFEITNKLTIVFRNILGVDVTTFNTEDGSSCLVFYPAKHIRCFKSVPINSTEELLPTFMEPVILLLGPSHANRTAVSVDNYLITAEGESFEEIDRKYTDLDLSVDKLILILMDYTST
jgi:hypothetical protein